MLALASPYDSFRRSGVSSRSGDPLLVRHFSDLVAELEKTAVDITCVPPRTLFVAGMLGAIVFSLIPAYDPQFFGDRRPELGPELSGDV